MTRDDKPRSDPPFDSPIPASAELDPHPDRDESPEEVPAEPLPRADEPFARAALRIAQLISSLPELGMRAAVLREKLSAVAPREAAGILQTVVRRGIDGGPPFNRALMALTEVLSSQALPYSLVKDIYQEAKKGGMGTLAAALFAGANENEVEPEPTAIDPGGKRLTLGERKWLARKPDRRLLERLARDADPRVIRNLLVNPLLTEQDVISIVTRRPSNPAVLMEISRSAKWIARYRVKRALVLNPYTPRELGLRLLPFLKRQDLRLVAESGNLPDELLQAARKLTRRR